ncbi:MAG: hypothetical protein ACRD1K_03080 [Acidimicrobiales bacterium]
MCVDCAGITTSFMCTTCGTEGELWFAHACLRCSLRRRLGVVLDGGAGTVNPSLAPLVEGLVAMGDPWHGLVWLGAAHVQRRLVAVATGEVALSHEGIDTLPGGQGREYLRELLVAHHVLPARDKYLAAYERWEIERLDSIDDGDDRQQIRAYLRWRHHRELSARAQAAPLTASMVAVARQRTNAGLSLLAWLRARHSTLAHCTQTDLDAWFATTSNARGANDFIVWAIRHQRCPPLTIPKHKRRSPTVGPQDQRLHLLRRLLSDDDIELAVRVAGCLVLLLAQPVTRIASLRLADIDNDNGQLSIRFGDDPVAIPGALATLVVALMDRRPNMGTAANLVSPWLLPGQAPGQHIMPNHLSRRLVRLGVTTAARQAAMHQLIADVPAPVLAITLGYHPQTTARRAAEQGTDWAAYAALKAGQTAST